NLLEEGIDLAVRIGPLVDSSMIATDAGVMRQVVVASPRLLAETGIPTEPGTLATLPCVQFLGGRAQTSWPFVVEGRPMLIRVQPRLTVNQALPAAAACAAGLGFGRFLAYQVREHVRRGELAIVLERYEPQPHPVSLLTTEARLMTQRLRRLRDALRAALLAGQE
ncbi:MAG: LysR family transcriptional regulator, partial [Gammaproteobacteria bacterium]|nr:LysR family transcriptional regulator [Gammaproteobacteria bacterium]